MGADGAHADVELPGDLGVGAALGDQSDQFPPAGLARTDGHLHRRRLTGRAAVACGTAAVTAAAVSPRPAGAAVAELLEVPAALLNDDRLGQSLEAMAKVAGDVRGQLMHTAVRRFPVADASWLHLDLTAVRFAGHYGGPGLAEKGWAADRTITRQVKTLQADCPGRGGAVLPAAQGIS